MSIAATSSLPSLSYEQLRSIRDVLKQPLANREVMIPFGSRAFLPGRLKPKLLNDPSNDECVIVSMKDGKREEMTRQQALDYLQTEMDEHLSSTKTKKIPPSSQTPLKSTLKKKDATTSNNSNNKNNNNTNHKVKSQQQQLQEEALPFFEIREEFDDSGKQTSGEAVDITQQLQMLQKVVNDDDNDNDDDDSPTPPRRNSAATRTRTAAAADDDNFEPVFPEPEPLKPISDQDYSVLAARLEELAKLEEGSTMEKKVNEISAKKIQSKGWAKGFLNNKSNKKKTKQSNQLKEASNEKAKSVTPIQSTTANDNTVTKKVAFGTEDAIREIPRIGERSVERPPPSRPIPSFSNNHDNNSTDTISERRMIEDSVFSGVIQEKKKKSKQPKQQQQQQQQQQPPKKKTSRFAQQRMQMN